MANLSRVVIGILILQVFVYAAPKDVSKPEDIAKNEQVSSKLDSEPKEINIKIENDSQSTELQRQKRWYNPYGYGFPPINPLIYPTINKRDDVPNSGFYEGDPFVQIHRRIQEIANAVRQPLPPPPSPHIPIFYPVLFVPPGDCNCNENPIKGVDNNSSPNNNPSLNNNPPPDNIPSPDNTTPSEDYQTTPTISNRWPEMEDNRQNWGLVVNKTDSSKVKIFNRPISFDPIRLNRPTRPTLPVEHGSVQSDSSDRKVSSQSMTPSVPEPSASNMPQNIILNVPQNSPPVRLAPPSPCDSAIITCCHQPQVAIDCFASQGCPDFTAYGNPCDPKLILRVIERFQTFYAQRAG